MWQSVAIRYPRPFDENTGWSGVYFAQSTGMGDKCQHGCINERFDRRADISDIGMEENGTELMEKALSDMRVRSQK